MKVKNKIIVTITATILLVILSFNSVLAATLSGLNGVQAILGMGSSAVGTEINLSLSDLRSANNKNLYCVQYHNENSINSHPYKVLTYIEISNGVAKVWDTNGLNGASSGSKRENKILAEILSGKYGKTGYSGAGQRYSPTQKALYVYWNIWLKEVGYEIGTNETWECKESLNDAEGTNVVNQATAAVDSGTVNPSARIYLLNEWAGAGQGWQRLMIADGSSSDITPPSPTKNPDYDGYIKIRGKVWVDGEAGKASAINGNYDNGEKGLGGIKVTLCDSGGSQFDDGSWAITEADGSYEIIVNLDPSYKVYKLYDEPNYVNDKLMNGAFVKFEYNGFEYTTVAAHSTGVNTSKATEDYGTRAAFDSANTTVQPGTGTPSGNNMTATTKSMIVFNSYPHKDSENENPTTLWCNSNGSKTIVYSTSATDKGTYWKTNDDEWKKPIELTGQQMHYKDHWLPNPNDPIYAPLKDAQGNVIGVDTNTILGYRNTLHDYREFCKHYASGGHSIQTTPITNLIINNVNLGLFKREQPDIALTSDIDKVKVVMNNQEYTYKYKTQTGTNTPSYNDDNRFGEVKFQNKYVYTYRRPVSPADIAYINDPNVGASNKTLRIYVTYKVTLSNQSNTLGVTVNKLVSDYDSEYEIQGTVSYYEGDKITSNGWGEATHKNGFKETVSDNLAIKISPKETKSIEVTYEISQNAIKGLIAQDSTLSNVFEIHTYSTQYGSNTLYAEQRTGGRTGKAYAGRDIDSQPGNAEPYVAERDIKIDKTTTRKEQVLDVKTGQDDTDIAPSFIIELAKEYKVISGTVYEDSQTKASQTNNQRLGDGKLGINEITKNNEARVQNVRVELWDLSKGDDKDGDGIKDGVIATMYQVNRNTGEVIARPAVTWTNENGDFWFGAETSFGVAVNKYKIKYVYGNNEIGKYTFDETSAKVNVNGKEVKYVYSDKDIKDAASKKATTINGDEINARNYKSTIVTQNPIKKIMKGETVTNSNKWHLLGGVDNTTVAVDTSASRNKVDGENLKNKNFDQAFNVEAESEPFELQVEYTIDPWAQLDENGEGSFNRTCTVFDFGIIERPREDLILNKAVTRLKLTLANGQIMIDGDPREKDLDYTKAPGMKFEIENAGDAKIRNRIDQMITIEMDAEYIQGAALEVWYDITATNNSEKDYNSQTYYYYGEGQKESELIDTYVNYVLDYLDPELICTIDEERGINTDWKVETAKELYDNGYLSETTYDKLVKENYLIFGTDVFKNNLPPGASHTTTLYASKLLGNQEEELKYDNCIEIVEINGRVARTIEKVYDDTRMQDDKAYFPGNSSLSIFEHEQDEDGVRITITPPTGLKDSIIIYIITTVIALAVIGTGVYIIKKRILK